MNFNKHSEIKGQHALFGASQNSWLRYDEDKIRERIRNQYRTALGTELHEFVAEQIVLNHKITNLRFIISGIENHIYTKYKIADDSKLSPYGMTLLKHVGTLPKEVFETARMYINDGIQYRMTVEQPLVYSEFSFGTADTISFRDNLLRISDYKSGDHPASISQLMVYAAYFFLEYAIKPRDVHTELRIYQSGEILLSEPDTEEIQEVMAKTIEVNRLAEKIKAKEG